MNQLSSLTYNNTDTPVIWSTAAGRTICMDADPQDLFMLKLAKKAEPYYRRGQTSVREGKMIRSFDEACDIIKAKFCQRGIAPDFAEIFACVFARAYLAGVAEAMKDSRGIDVAVT